MLTLRGSRVQPDKLIIQLIRTNISNLQEVMGGDVLHVPWQKSASTRRREILLPESVPSQNARPIRSETRATLVASIARGRRWLDELVADPAATAESIANREGCSVRKINMTISLALPRTRSVKATIEVPRGMGVARLCDMPAEWPRQRLTLGLPGR